MEVTKDMIPAKYLAQCERSESASLCYYLQQVGKPVGNPGASGKLGVLGGLSRSQGAGRGRSVAGQAPPPPSGSRGARGASLQPKGAESLRPVRPLALSRHVATPRKPPACPATSNLRQVPPAVLENFPGAQEFWGPEERGSLLPGCLEVSRNPLPENCPCACRLSAYLFTIS